MAEEIECRKRDRLTRVNWRWQEIHESEMNSLNLWHCSECVRTQTADLSGWINPRRSWNITNSTTTFNLKVCQKCSRHCQLLLETSSSAVLVRISFLKVKYRSVYSLKFRQYRTNNVRNITKITQLEWTSKRLVFFFRVVSVLLQILSHARNMNN